jgi:hypothetical protein
MAPLEIPLQPSSGIYTGSAEELHDRCLVAVSLVAIGFARPSSPRSMSMYAGVASVALLVKISM